mmetsp:Transcript_55384/g.161673  ORF Transcript_55384/g.161673 Transcript_55384/m.161673 type:complete len:205 (+) Transcript_55384:355-969(+)
MAENSAHDIGHGTSQEEQETLGPERPLLCCMRRLLWQVLELACDNGVVIARPVRVKDLLDCPRDGPAALAADGGTHVLQERVVVVHLVGLDHAGTRGAGVRHRAPLEGLHARDLLTHALRAGKLEAACKHLGQPAGLDRGSRNVCERCRLGVQEDEAWVVWIDHVAVEPEAILLLCPSNIWRKERGTLDKASCRDDEVARDYFT